MIINMGQTDTLTTEKRTAYRPMALQYAVTAVLTQAPDVEPFAGKQVIIPAERFAALVTRIVETANQPGWATNPGYTWTPIFTREEAATGLRRRGYQPGEIPVTVPSPTVIVPAVPYTTPTPVIVIQPEPYFTEAPDPYQPPPAPVEIALPVLKEESLLKQEKEVDVNMILWLLGAIGAGLLLGGMTKPKG